MPNKWLTSKSYPERYKTPQFLYHHERRVLMNENLPRGRGRRDNQGFVSFTIVIPLLVAFAPPDNWRIHRAEAASIDVNEAVASAKASRRRPLEREGRGASHSTTHRHEAPHDYTRRHPRTPTAYTHHINSPYSDSAPRASARCRRRPARPRAAARAGGVLCSA